jgi:dextranase
VKEALLADLRCAYGSGEEIAIGGLDADAAQVVVRTAFGETFAAQPADGEAVIAGVPSGTHALEIHSATAELMTEEMFSVRDYPGQDPILAFATSFDVETVPHSLRWLERLRCTAVQIYDWMESYSAPLGPASRYQDQLGRTIDRPALESLIRGIKRLGAIPQAYAPVLAADPGDHRELRLYRTDGAPESLGNLLDIMDPGARPWQQSWLEQYGHASDTLGFEGFHLDTYGYPRCAVDVSGGPVAIEAGFDTFVRAIRAGRPADLLSFNQVNGVPHGFEPPASPAFRYVEVWPPNDQWRHLEALMDRSAGQATRRGDTLAVYPSPWGGDRDSALRTAVFTEAVTTMLGMGILIWGDNRGVLRQPYYVDHERLRSEEAETALGWHRFALRCRDLFRAGSDTSWYELEDENAAVTVTAARPVKPEPLGGALFARVVHTETTVVVGLLDLSGSTNGSWSEGTAPGVCTAAKVAALVAAPEQWRACVATLGRNGGRFTPTQLQNEPHREGRAVACEVPIVAGWTVVRLEKDTD